MKVDPVTLEVLRNRFDAIANNMVVTLIKSAYSAVIKEGADCSVAIFDPKGDTIAQGLSNPVHLGSLPPAVKMLLAHFPAASLEDGDVVMTNDPYSGGQHYPDVIVGVPIVYGGETVAIAVALAHQQDVGGKTPGSTPTDAKSVFEEGLCIPPIKLMVRGEIVSAVEAFIRYNTRFPDLIMGDLHAQIAAGRAAAGELMMLMDSYGKDVVLAAKDALLERAESQARAFIETIPDGIYRFTDWLDNDGVDIEQRIPIQLALTIKGSDVHADFTGTSGQVKGPINAVPPISLSAVRYVFRAIMDPEIPNNEGCYRMIKLTLPEGSLLNPRRPAPVCCRSVTQRRVADTVLGAIAQALPGKVPAASNGHPLWAAISGRYAHSEKPFIIPELGTGGMGARPTKDGIDAIQTDASNSMNLPVEVAEMNAPIRISYYRIRKDSGGAGRFRGGCGYEKEFVSLVDHVHVSHRGERHFTQPWGLDGGQAGAFSESWIMRADGSRQKVPSKMDFVLNSGDRLIVRTSGGGGYGNPRERSRRALLDDMLDHKVGVDSARDVYGVTIDGDSNAGDDFRRG